MLASEPGVTDFALEMGQRPILRYTYLDKSGDTKTSRIMFDARMDAPASYEFEIIGNNGLSYETIQSLMTKCNLAWIMAHSPG